jgi:hypothetical protein
MEAFLPESVKIVLLGVFAAGIVLVWVSRRLPQVAWLEPFRLRGFQLTEAQKARHRRFHIIKAGFEIMLAALPCRSCMYRPKCSCSTNRRPWACSCQARSPPRASSSVSS